MSMRSVDSPESSPESFSVVVVVDVEPFDSIFPLSPHAVDANASAAQISRAWRCGT